MKSNRFLIYNNLLVDRAGHTNAPTGISFYYHQWADYDISVYCLNNTIAF